MIPAAETPAERELRLAWKQARRDFRRTGIPYNEHARLTAAVEGVARANAAAFSYERAEIEAICGEAE